MTTENTLTGDSGMNGDFVQCAQCEDDPRKACSDCPGVTTDGE